MKLNKEGEILQINALVYTMGKRQNIYSKRLHLEKLKAMRRSTTRLLRNLTTILYRRRMLFMSVQKEGEAAEAFIRNLYELAEHCEFGTQRDERIRDRIVIGIRDKSLSQKLQMRSDLNLDIAVQMARQSELVKSQIAGQSECQHLGEIHRKKGRPNLTRRPVQNVRDKNPKNAPSVQPCFRCNRIHKQDETCPARGKKCS